MTCGCLESSPDVLILKSGHLWWYLPLGLTTSDNDNEERLFFERWVPFGQSTNLYIMKHRELLIWFWLSLHIALCSNSKASDLPLSLVLVRKIHYRSLVTNNMNFVPDYKKERILIQLLLQSVTANKISTGIIRSLLMFHTLWKPYCFLILNRFFPATCTFIVSLAYPSPSHEQSPSFYRNSLAHIKT